MTKRLKLFYSRAQNYVVRDQSLRSTFPTKNPPSGRTAKRVTLCYRHWSNVVSFLFMREESLHEAKTDVKLLPYLDKRLVYRAQNPI
jgi:hypothetical protein